MVMVDDIYSFQNLSVSVIAGIDIIILVHVNHGLNSGGL